MVSRQLTSFQQSTESALITALGARGLGLENRRLAGVNETYVVALVDHLPFEVFIYEQEAGIQGANISFQFETPDYDTPDELCAAFVGQVVALATDVKGAV